MGYPATAYRGGQRRAPGVRSFQPVTPGSVIPHPRLAQGQVNIAARQALSTARRLLPGLIRANALDLLLQVGGHAKNYFMPAQLADFIPGYTQVCTGNNPGCIGTGNLMYQGYWTGISSGATSCTITGCGTSAQGDSGSGGPRPPAASPSAIIPHTTFGKPHEIIEYEEWSVLPGLGLGPMRSVWVRPGPAIDFPGEVPPEVPALPDRFIEPGVTPGWLPWVDPLSVPVHAPQPAPWHPPYRAVPNRPRRDPNVDPNEMPEVGPEPAPSPLPEPFPEVIATPRPRGLPQAPPSPALELWPNTGRRLAPHYHRSPPGPGVKERKLIGQIDGGSPLGKFLNGITEGADLVDCLFKSLPASIQKKSGKLPQEKAATLYRHADKMDPASALMNCAQEMAEDWFFGKLGKAAGEFTRNIGGHSGPGRLSGQGRRTLR